SFSAIQADVAKTVPDTSLTQAKIGSGQVVKSINNLHDQIVLQGANGASITAVGDTITVTASGGGGGGIGTIQNTDNTIAITNPAGPTATVNLQSPLTIPGKLGIGSAPYWPFHLKESESTGNGLEARVTNTSTVSNSFASFSLDANSGVVVNQMVADGLGTGPLGMPSGYVGTFSNHSLGLVTNNVERLHIAPGGYIGIGTTNPFYSLDINGFFRTKSVAGGNIVSETDGGTNAWAKFWVKTPARQWSIGSSNNFNGNQLYFSDETGGGTIDMAIMPGGNVGIGTVGPTVKLHVAGSGVLESSVQSTNERAILSLNSTISGQNRIWTLENGIFGIAGLFGIYDRTAGRAALTINTNGVVKAENDAAQSRDRGGFVKAMAYVNGDGSLLRSFNGVNSTAITSTRTTGGYRVNFPFQINDRFVSVTVEDGCCLTGAIASYSFDPNSNSSLLVYVRISGASDGYTTDRPVMVIIY
ncbi:MAG TPA: hypothetical protein VL633_04300, partial [Bacteroidota bacterium]|nr:hypothetical protein [Bacteroidota bacterium]